MTVDVAAFLSGTPFAEQSLANEMNNGETVSGMRKLSQRFVLELMTSTDSVPKNSQGCDFVARMVAGVASENDVFLALHASLGRVTDLMLNSVLPDDPDSEILSGISVDRLALATGSLTLTLRLRNKAGELQSVTVPLHFILN